MTSQFKYNIDIVLCIDATGDMNPVIDMVKANALKFHDDLSRVMAEKSKIIDSLRIKVIMFRDYYCDREPMKESQFFTLPAAKEDFQNFINGIYAKEGGDEPDNGLEALALAIKSDWATTGDRHRHIIIILTDASAHKLERYSDSKPENYPIGLPKNFDELTEWWNGQNFIGSSSKGLIMYAPDAYPWTDIANYWKLAIHCPSKAGEGLSEADYYSFMLDHITCIIDI